MSKNPLGIELSIIVPVYNEEKGIGKTIVDIYSDAKLDSINKIVNSLEIIVVDDGSTDDTYPILQKIKKTKKIKIIQHKSNQGLGAAILTGVNNSTKKYITYLPADGQAFLRDIPKGLKAAPNADLVLTYRGIRHDYNNYRHILSNSLMIFMKVFFNLNFKDFNWVHIYKRDLFKLVRVNSKGVFYLGEIIVRSHEMGFKIVEAKASYHPRSTGSSKNAKLSIVLQTFLDLFKLWIELKLRPHLK